MTPATISLVSALVREVGVPIARDIAGLFRAKGRADLADATEAALGRSDADLDDVIATARREQSGQA
jgi:hypothetical protein